MKIKHFCRKLIEISVFSDNGVILSVNHTSCLCYVNRHQKSFYINMSWKNFKISSEARYLFFALSYISRGIRNHYTSLPEYHIGIPKGLIWSVARFRIRFVLEDVSHRWFSKSMRYRHCRQRHEKENCVGGKSWGDNAHRRGHRHSGAFNFWKKKNFWKKERKQTKPPAPERCERHSLTGVT